MDTFEKWLETEFASALFGVIVNGGNPHTSPAEKTVNVNKAQAVVDMLEKVLAEYREFKREDVVELK